MSPCPKVHSLQLRKEYLFFLSLELYFSVFVALTHSLDIKKRRQKVLEDAIDKAQGTHLVALDRHAPFKTQGAEYGMEDNHQYMVMCIVSVFSFWKCSLEKDQPMKYLRGTLPSTATSNLSCLKE